MELVNTTGMPGAFTLGMAPDGREALVVVVKGTFTMPEAGDLPVPAGEQVALVTADTWMGEPGLSLPLAESDFAPVKERCDIVLHGVARAPDGRPATRVPVLMQVGRWSKTFDVVGDRVWQVGAGGVRPGDPQPFTAIPVSWGCAFGGASPSGGPVFARNPVGRGFAPDPAIVDGLPLPNTESPADPVLRPDGDYLPLAFGPVGRGWMPRAGLAGTYDDRWRSERFPFLPADFDRRFYQCAPADQWIDFPVGGETVRLEYLSSRGIEQFPLPRTDLPVEVYPRRGGCEAACMRVDTLVIEPERRRFSLVWRFARLLRRNLFEVAQIVVGARRATRPAGLRSSAIVEEA